MNVVDLFAGAGGLSYGFQMAGCRVLCGIDNDKDCAATFRKNHPRSEYLTKNIEDVTSDDMTRLVGRNKVDILVGGPPCQGFSISGKRTSSDPRNQLYAHFLRIADMLSPQAVLIENVPGLQALFGGRVFADIVDKLHKRGFKTSVKVVSADDYGVPQSRKRIMIVGARNEKYVFPEPNGKKITLWESISDLPLLEGVAESSEYSTRPSNEYQERMREGSTWVSNHVATNHTDKTRRIISMVKEGQNYKSLPEHLQKTRNVHIAWTRLDGSRPSLTIDTGHRHHFHPKANRIPTVRESARIQSFPDRFVFVGTKTSQYRQVGNAVPPFLAYNLSINMIKMLQRGKIQDTIRVQV